jgi:hypothetical protein
VSRVDANKPTWDDTIYLGGYLVCRAGLGETMMMNEESYYLFHNSGVEDQSSER